MNATSSLTLKLAISTLMLSELVAYTAAIRYTCYHTAPVFVCFWERGRRFRGAGGRSQSEKEALALLAFLRNVLLGISLLGVLRRRAG